MLNYLQAAQLIGSLVVAVVSAVTGAAVMFAWLRRHGKREAELVLWPDLNKRFSDRDERMEKTYVKRETYDAHRSATEQRLVAIETTIREGNHDIKSELREIRKVIAIGLRHEDDDE